MYVCKQRNTFTSLPCYNNYISSIVYFGAVTTINILLVDICEHKRILISIILPYKRHDLGGLPMHDVPSISM